MDEIICEEVWRIAEGASWEDIENGDAYERAYLVYINGELVWDTTKYKYVQHYFENYSD